MHTNLKARRSLSSFGVSMESIDFQRDSFGSQIEAILFDINKFLHNTPGSDMELRMRLQDHELLEMLSDLFMSRLGLNVSIEIDPGRIGGSQNFIINSNHVLLKPYIRGTISAELQDKILNLVKKRTGSVDLKNAKVTGAFSEFKSILKTDLVGLFLYGGYTIPEVTAIILHELGHTFNSFALADRLETTNQILATLSKELKGGNNNEKRNLLFKDLALQFGLKDTDLGDLVNETNNTIIGVRLFDLYIKQVKSQLPNAKYDETASEALADNFAARFGYGRQLVLALNHNAQTTPEQNDFIAKFMNFTQFITDFAFPGIVIIFSILGSWGIIGVGVALYYSVTLVWSGENYQDYTYDSMKIRYQRIRQQYIEMIKKLNLDKEELRAVVDHIHFIDNIIQGTKVYRGLYNRLANFIFTSSRDTVKSIEMQQVLEELTHNSLFLKSAELSVLS